MRILAILSGILIAFALVLGTSVWLLLQPGFAVDQARDLVAERYGHKLTVGQSHVVLLPEPAVIFEDVVLTEPGRTGSPLLRAREMTLRTSFGAMIARDLSADAIVVDGAHINLAVDSTGVPNWSAQDGESPALPVLTLNGASIAFVDERTGLALRLDAFKGLVTVTEEGTLSVEGDLILAGKPGSVAASITSLKRLGLDGSPASISVRGNGYEFSFDGRLAMTKSLGLAGQAVLEWPDHVALSGPFEAIGKTIAFKSARLESAVAAGTGDLIANFSGQVPRVESDFDLDRFDLAALLPRLAFDGSWSERPLGFGRLKQAEVAAKLNVHELRLGALSLGRTSISITAQDGRLQASAPAISLYGGVANVGFSIDCSRSVPEMAFSLEAENLSLPQSRGTIPSASVMLTSAGFSQAELAGRLNGSASFVVKNGIWALPSFEDILKNVGDGILSDWGAAPSRSASFGEMSASFTIADGIATTRDLRISAPDIEVTGSGEIDVLRHAIDLKAEPARADGKPAFPVPLIVQGPWLSPRVFPDMPGILEDPDAAYKALHKLKLAQETKK